MPTSGRLRAITAWEGVRSEPVCFQQGRQLSPRPQTPGAAGLEEGRLGERLALAAWLARGHGQVCPSSETRPHWAVMLVRSCSRLAALEARVAQLQEARAQQAQQVDALQARNAAQRAAYEALRGRAGLQEAALRRLEEEAHDLLERLVQRKARAAAERNLRNERREK